MCTGYTHICIVKEFNLNKNNVFFLFFDIKSFLLVGVCMYVCIIYVEAIDKPTSLLSLPSKHKPLIIVIKLIFKSIIFIAVPIIYRFSSRSSGPILPSLGLALLFTLVTRVCVSGLRYLNVFIGI